MESSGLNFVNMNLHYFRFPFSYFLSAQKAIDVDKIVFWSSVPHLWVDQYGAEDAITVMEQARDSGVEVCAYAVRPYNYSLFYPMGTFQQECTKRYYCRNLEIASQNKISLVGIDLWGALRDIDYERQYTNCIAMLDQLCQVAKGLGCKLVVGNVSPRNSAIMNTLAELQRLVAEVDSDALCIGLDLAEAICQQERIVDWHKAFGQSLKMVYFSDARNGVTGYPLGTGCCALHLVMKELQKLKYGGLLALRMDRERCEQHPKKVDEINYSYIRRERKD